MQKHTNMEKHMYMKRSYYNMADKPPTKKKSNFDFLNI